MIIDAVSDLHGYLPVLAGGDLLLLMGDYTAADKYPQWCVFFDWLKKQNYEKKILIAGNHDNLMESGWPKSQEEANNLKEVQEYLDEDDDFEYLCDSGTEFKGLKIWGTPWSPWFKGVNPKCKAFMDSEKYINRRFDRIPIDTDILMTHSPPCGIKDKTIRGESVGSVSLGMAITRLVAPKAIVFGHIHEDYGIASPFIKGCIMANCSYVNAAYEPANKPIRIEI